MPNLGGFGLLSQDSALGLKVVDITRCGRIIHRSSLSRLFPAPAQQAQIYLARTSPTLSHCSSLQTPRPAVSTRLSDEHLRYSSQSPA